MKAGRMSGMMRSRGKLAAGLGALGFDHKTMQIHAGKKICAKNLKEAVVALRLAKSGWMCRHTKESWLCCKEARTCNCEA